MSPPAKDPNTCWWPRERALFGDQDWCGLTLPEGKLCPHHGVERGEAGLQAGLAFQHYSDIPLEVLGAVSWAHEEDEFPSVSFYSTKTHTRAQAWEATAAKTAHYGWNPWRRCHTANYWCWFETAGHSDRKARGYGLYLAGKVQPVREGLYLVGSGSQEFKGYYVNLTMKVCTCPDFEKRRKPCKHFFAALAFSGE